MLRNARRACGVGLYNFRQPASNDPAWTLLVDALWRYQWVKHVEPLTPALRETLYDLTQGITDFLAKLIILAQRYAIQSGKERLSVSVLRHVASTKMQLLQPALDALRSGDAKRMRQFDDLLPSEAHFNTMMMVESPSAGSSVTFLRQVVSGEMPLAAETNQEITQTNGGAPQRQVAKDIASQADTLDALKKAGWMATDPFEFSTQYCVAV